MTEENYAQMEKLAGRLAAGLEESIERHNLPWHVQRVGARVEFICAPGPLKNGGEAEAAHASELEAAVHVALVNRGVLIAPFHNMMLISPETTKKQVDKLIGAFDDIAADLVA
jgi:glutamate-1-semialdehyde 2,1-aminomutase